MALNDILEARIVCLTGQQVSINVRHYRITTVVAPEPALSDIAFELDDEFGFFYKRQLSSSASYRGVGVRRIAPGPRTVESVYTANSGPGTRGADLLPKQVSALVSLRTAEATRRGRGRVYIPFPSETDNNPDAVPSAAYLLDLAGLASGFDNAVVVLAGGGSLTVTPGIFRKADGTFRNITSVIARDRWATQRRRGDLGRTNTSPF